MTWRDSLQPASFRGIPFHIDTADASFGRDFKPISETTSTRRQQALNQRLLKGLMRQTALLGMASSIIDVNFSSYNDAAAARDLVAEELDVEIIALGTTDDDTAYMAMEDLRADVIFDVTERAANLRRVKTITPIKCLPALVTSYTLYESADYDAEIIARNKVRHPGFLPANQPLQVLV